MNLFYQIVCILSSVLVLAQAIGAVREMSRSTDHLIRLAYVLISSGSLAEALSVFSGHTPDLGETLFMSGVGLLAMVDRRIVRCSVDRIFRPEGGEKHGN